MNNCQFENTDMNINDILELELIVGWKNDGRLIQSLNNFIEQIKKKIERNAAAIRSLSTSEATSNNKEESVTEASGSNMGKDPDFQTILNYLKN